MFRRPTDIERLYIDFDCFFASVEQQLQPQLRHRPIGVLPFMSKASCVIAPSREAKQYGVKTGTRVPEAMQLCPDIVFTPARHDVYVRLHHEIYQQIERCIHIDQACSIDEVVCSLVGKERKYPEDLAYKINKTLVDAIGKYITCSMGFAPNRLLAKIAGDFEKPQGIVIWYPDAYIKPLFSLELMDIPGIGYSMEKRLNNAKIYTIAELWVLTPKHMREIWGSVEGERFWYSLRGYAVEPIATTRRMFGHSRILTPESRIPRYARNCARLLTVKAARRLRRANLYASAFSLTLKLENKIKWSADAHFLLAADDHTFLTALSELWAKAMQDYPSKTIRIKQVSVAIYHLESLKNIQTDMFLDLPSAHLNSQNKWIVLTQTMDKIVEKYGSRAASLGMWEEPPGGYAGAKIAFGRIPNLSDF